MRTLLAGLVVLALAIGVTEYQRREGAATLEAPESGEAGKPDKPALPKPVAKLLETDAPGTDAPARDAALAALLTQPEGDGPFATLAAGTFEARELRGGFGAALFVIEAGGKAGVVRAAPGEAPQLLFSRPSVGALAVDGSTVFFAEGGLIGSTHARAADGVTVRARFKHAVVTSLAASGDTVVATLMPRDADPLSTDAVGAVVSIDGEGEVTLMAQEQTRPRAAQTDGKDAYWVAGFPPALWRGGLDGTFSSQLSDTAEPPVTLDGDAVYFRAPLGSGVELKRVGRAGGKLASLATGDVQALAVSSGLVRFATGGEAPKLLELTSGAEPSELLALPGAPRGVAVGGTTLFVLTQEGDTAVLRAK